MPTNIFVNLPIKDLKKSTKFFSSLGFTFNAQFTDDKATCMVISQNIFAMLLLEPFFQTFTKKSIADATKTTEVIVSLSVESKQVVDDMLNKVIAAGGREAREKQEFDFMYGRSFEDLDGHIWEVIWMDQSYIQKF